MGHFADYASARLGVKVPEDYSSFMETHGKKLPEDPVLSPSWLGGLGSSDFVVGTTGAFRSMVRGFSPKMMVIGFVGLKTIIINKAYEDIEEYLMLNTADGSVHTVDYRGVSEKVAGSFQEWVTPALLRATLKEKYASNLTVVIFDDELKAEEARLKLLKLQREGFVELEDAVVVVKDAAGEVRFHQMQRKGLKGGLAGSITGLIVGSILFSPLLGAAFGALTGAVCARLSDVGIDDQFMKDLSKEFQSECAALFTLVKKADPERVAEAFMGFGGKVLMNSVSQEREAVIQAILDGAGESGQ